MFRRSPSLSFMYGALGTTQPQGEERNRRVRQATKYSDLKETKALTIEQTETEENITDRIVQKVLRKLVEKFKDNDKKPINYYEFVLHPSNFGTSIENIFHVSFLVKENKAGISICPDTGMPLIRPVSMKQKDSSEEVTKAQVVMNWSVRDWRRLVKDLNILTPMID